MMMLSLILALAAASPEPAAATPEKPVCKKVEMEPGSPFKKRLCMSKAEWEQAAKAEKGRGPAEQVRQTAPTKPY